MSDVLRLAKGLSVQPKCIVILGVKSEAIISWAIGSDASKVLIIEPEEDLAKQIARAVAKNNKADSVIVEHGVPVFDHEHSSELPFYSCNISGYSSSVVPTGIKSLRPALHFNEKKIKTVPLNKLLTDMGVNESDVNLLITQLNGAENFCLRPTVIREFTHLIFQTPRTTLFGEESSLSALHELLTQEERDFFQVPESSPPFINLISTKPAGSWKASKYFSHKSDHEKKLTELEDEISKLNEKNHTLKSHATELKEEHEKCLQSILELQERNKKEKDESDAEYACAIRKADEEKAKREASEHQLAQVNQKLSELTENKKEIELQVRSLKKENNDKEQELQLKVLQSEELINTKTEEIKTLYESLSESKGTQKEHLAALTMTNKLNLKLQADLDNLRQRYLEKVRKEEELSNLVDELYVKLKQASEFYYKLEQRYPEIVGVDNE